MTVETKKKKQLPRGIQRRGGRLRLYVTKSDGTPTQPLVTWKLLRELEVPVPPTRLAQPGAELAKAALIKMQARVLSERKTGAIEASAKVKIADLFGLIESDYRQQGLKSLGHLQGRWTNHLKPFFGNICANELSSSDIDRYIDLRMEEEEDSASTVNRELAALRRVLKLGQRTKPPRVRNIPYFPHLTEPKARQGFLTDETFLRLGAECSAEGAWLRGMFCVGANFGWRKSECILLQVHQLDLVGRTITLAPGTTKNNEGRVVRMPTDVHAILSACAAGKGPNDYVFTRDDGQRIHDFRTAWENACARAGCPDLLFHDLRRTAARNLRRLGVSEGVIMKIGGWKTRDVFDRYNIIDEADLADAAQRLDDKRERERLERERVATESTTGTGIQTGTETGIMEDGAEQRVQ